jgi:hypothetical protein
VRITIRGQGEKPVMHKIIVHTDGVQKVEIELTLNDS